MRPCKNKTNTAMVYVVGPENDQAQNAKDFLDAVQVTGKNVYRAVVLYNQQTTFAHIHYVRMCLVSGGLFRHLKVQPPQVAEALISGISDASYQLSETFSEANKTESKQNGKGGMGVRVEHILPHINFAFAEKDLFQRAYTRMQKDVGTLKDGGDGGGGSGRGDKRRVTHVDTHAASPPNEAAVAAGGSGGPIRVRSADESRKRAATEMSTDTTSSLAGSSSRMVTARPERAVKARVINYADVGSDEEF